MTTTRRFNLNFATIWSKHKTSKSLGKKYLRFNLGFIAAALIPTFAVGLVNVVVDPYDAFNTPNFLGINNSKPDKDNNDRLFKALDVVRIKPRTILIGSSRAKQGLDPTHPALQDQTPVYNLALNGPNFYELRRYLEHAIANQPDLKEVVLGVDFFMFNATLKNQPSFTEERLEKQSITIQDTINSTFSWDVLAASQETINASLKEVKKNDNYGENGFMPNRKLKQEETQWRFDSGIKLYYSLHSTYQFSDEYFEEFKKFVELCKQRGINLKVFISPAHATDLEAIRATGRWQTFEEWKRKMVQITPVWDFSGYNSITSEPISAKMKNYADNSHYTPLIGNLILNRIFSDKTDKVPKDFGVLITPQNIDSYQAKIHADREAWAKKNPDEVELAKNIKREYDRSSKSKQ
jgi:hypothetical protein